MQQTEKYQLNLIETSDAFSPAALNQNTQKVEAALAAKADTAETGQQLAALAAANTALDGRVTVLEAHKMVVGSYTGNGIPDGQTIDLGFTPAAVLVGKSGNSLYLLTPENPAGYFAAASIYYLKVVVGGFWAGNSGGSIDGGWNTQNQTYYFIALV